MDSHLLHRGNGTLWRRGFAVCILALTAALAFSCASVNIGQVEPVDLCKCNPLDQGIEYRHGCIPAEPASVSPGEVIVVVFEESASSDLASRRSCRWRRASSSLAIACRVDLSLSPGEHVVRRYITDGAVQAYGVVVIHVGLNQA